MSAICQGIEKLEAQQKESGTSAVRSTGGREKMDFRIYRKVCFDLLTCRAGNGGLDSVAGAQFLNKNWNLMCRTQNVKAINWSDCKYVGDHRATRFHRAKCDTGGKEKITTDDRHTYANPIMPEICPFTVEGIYILCVGTGAEGGKMFHRLNASKNFDLQSIQWAKFHLEWMNEHDLGES